MAKPLDVRLLAAKNALESLKISLLLMGEKPDDVVKDISCLVLHCSGRKPARVYIDSNVYTAEIGWRSRGTFNFMSRNIEEIEQWLFKNYFGESKEGWVACTLATLKM